MQDFLAANDEARRRLIALVQRPKVEDLQLEIETGSAVAAALGHLAFTDLRALTLLRRGEIHGVGPSPVDADAINDACRTLLRRLPGDVCTLVLEGAAAIDHSLLEVAPSRVAEIESQTTQFHRSRRPHRNLHVDEIEARLASRTARA